MSYVAPDLWQHGDKPTAAKVNKWKTDLDEIHAKVGDRAVNLPCGFDDAATRIYFLHTHRYLHYYADAGVLTDPAAVGEAVTLDSGGGFSQAALDRAFDPFYSTKMFGRGTGLGLAIVKSFVEESGGDIQIRNTTIGACVEIFLPAIDTDRTLPK